jgi:hypothetical protein
VTCPLFRRCGQYAMVLPLESAADAPGIAASLPRSA